MRTLNAAIRLLLGLVLTVVETSPAQTPRSLVGARFDAVVVTVVDGDTFDVVREGEKLSVRIRLEGVDSPERGEPFSDRARTFTRVLLFDQKVRVTGRDIDRYGRLVARVNVAGNDASVQLVQAGLACHYTAYSSDPLLARAESESRAAGRGFWARDAQKPRCTTGTRQAPDGRGTGAVEKPVASGFRGNTSSHVYHASWCPNYTCRNCTRVFANEADAKAAGYRPAGDCLGK